MSNDDRIKITSEEIARVVLTPSPSQVPGAQPGPRSDGRRDFGSVAGQPGEGVISSGPGNLLLRSWVYLGLAGVAGALLAWALCEPFYQGGVPHGVAHLLGPLVITSMCLAFASAECWAERSSAKYLRRAVLAVVLGAVLGCVLITMANLLYTLLLAISAREGGESKPVHQVIARSVGWGVYGVASGAVYGVIGGSIRKGAYGILGGVAGAVLGGALFDPISWLFGNGTVSRAVALVVYAAGTGMAMGLVEDALKDRWIFVSGGPLAGKQFILYEALTTLGSAPTSDIYLFKDTSILPAHATIEIRGRQAVLLAADVVCVNGEPLCEHTLRSGDRIQIGRYTLDFREKRRSA